MVRVGSARSNERGGITGGKPGDQKGGAEVSTQAWYLHRKGWIVIRAKEPSVREKIARNMEAACRNNHIGYCQDHRGTATEAAKPYGYDFSRITTDVETDCSELVRACCLYAGIQVGSFSTGNEVAALQATGKFQILKEDKYCTSSEFLLRGDILVTKTKGHTAVVLDSGSGSSKSQGTASKPVSSTDDLDKAQGFRKDLAGTYTVTASALNIRRGAGTTKKTIGIIHKGKTVQCFGYYTAVGGTKWLLIREITSGITGFCSENYLKK